MKALRAAISGALLMAAIALAGCGAAGTPAANVPTVPFKSPDIHGTSIPVRYTCDGKNVSPSFEWGAVPAKTKELALFVVGVVPHPTANTYSVALEWAIAGINPNLHKITAGHPPPGAYPGVLSHNRIGYNLCPSARTREQFQFELYGVNKAGLIAHGFGAASVLLGLGKHPELVTTHGIFVATYKRH